MLQQHPAVTTPKLAPKSRL